jgi:hypothetical protein
MLNNEQNDKQLSKKSEFMLISFLGGALGFVLSVLVGPLVTNIFSGIGGGLK